MKTLRIRNLRSFVLAAALMGTADSLFGQVVFTENFDDEDISDWTAGDENLDNPGDTVFPPSAVGGQLTLHARASCFTFPFSAWLRHSKKQSPSPTGHTA